MIRINKLMVGDIIGTTSGSPLAMIIKARTWGWRKMFSQKHSSHIAVVVDRGHGLLYFAEMLAGGIALTNIQEYNNRAPRQHICFVGRHPTVASSAMKRGIISDQILYLHSRKVKYGFDDLFDYLTESFGIHIPDKESTLICSELPRVGFKKADVETPSAWDEKCSPQDWQSWVNLHNMTEEVIC